MAKALEKELSRETAKRRQQEIVRCLAQYGLARGPRRLLLDAGGEEPYCRRLAAALLSLGPVFCSFGIYLSSRVDLLPAKDCLELAAIPDWADATPIEIVWDLITREIDCSLSEVYSVFEEEPFDARLILQSHRAKLHNGEAVVVKVVRPEYERQLVRDAKMLSLLRSVFARGEWPDLPIDDAISDFLRTMQQQLNLLHEAEALEAAAHDLTEFGSLRAPMVHRKFCTSKVLTTERLSGSTLDHLIQGFDEANPKEYWTADTPAEINRVDLRKLGSQLSLLWLRLALQGRFFPVEPRPENILILSNNQIVFTGGTLATLPAEAKANLLTYLTAASTQDPDRACSSLIKEMRKSTGAADEEELRHKLRQVVAFRDGGWSSSGSSDSLAELLFVHWRLAGCQGYRPLLPLLSFFRGFFWIANSIRRLSRDKDALLEALEDLRLNAAMSQFRQMMNLPQLGNVADRYATMMMELPGKLDEAMTVMAEGNALLKLERTRITERSSHKSSSAVVISLLLLLAAVVVLSHYISTAVAGVWVDRISAIVFLAVSALLFRVRRPRAER